MLDKIRRRGRNLQACTPPATPTPAAPAIGYVRVSTEQQADSGLSIAAQRVKLEALATLNDYQLD